MRLWALLITATQLPVSSAWRARLCTAMIPGRSNYMARPDPSGHARNSPSLAAISLIFLDRCLAQAITLTILPRPISCVMAIYRLLR